jgi:hypothetical protein
VQAAAAAESAAGVRAAIEEELGRAYKAVAGGTDAQGNVNPEGAEAALTGDNSWFGDSQRSIIAGLKARLAIAEEQDAENAARLAAEQTKLNAMREADKAVVEEQSRKMEAAARAVEAEERRRAQQEKAFGTESQIRGVDSSIEATKAREERAKRQEDQARGWSRREAKAREEGMPVPERPPELRDRSWEYDQTNDRVRWLNSTQRIGGAAQEIAASFEAAVEMMVDATKRIEDAVSRGRNDGTRIG